MTHWSDGYLDIPYRELNCAELVERVLREQLGRDLHFPLRENNNLFHQSALITAYARDFAIPIATPSDGCAVVLLARGRMAHVGLYCLIGGVGYVLHADSSFGSSTRPPMTRMVPPRYRIEGFYEWIY